MYICEFTQYHNFDWGDGFHLGVIDWYKPFDYSRIMSSCDGVRVWAHSNKFKLYKAVRAQYPGTMREIWSGIRKATPEDKESIRKRLKFEGKSRREIRQLSGLITCVLYFSD